MHVVGGFIFIDKDETELELKSNLLTKYTHLNKN